jgi:hypothetical protein
MSNELGRGNETEIEEHFIGSLQLCNTPSFGVFEKYPAGISVSQHHNPGTANGHGNHNNLKTSYRAKLINYVLGAIQ